jgi:hypothetical protein
MNDRIESIAKMDKYAVFENQLTGESRIIKLELVMQNGSFVNLGMTFHMQQALSTFFNNAGEFLTGTQIFYMNPNTEICQFLGSFPLDEEICIEIDRRKRDKLYFKFRRMDC